MWFYDGKVLDDMFHYQSQTTDDYWKEILKNHSYYKMGQIVPKGLISTFAIKRLFKDDNSPAYWFKHNDEAKMLAYFGGSEKYKKIPPKWEEFNLLVEGKDENGEKIDYENMRKVKNAKLINYHCDLDKEKFTLKDLQDYAKEFQSASSSHIWQGNLRSQGNTLPGSCFRFGLPHRHNQDLTYKGSLRHVFRNSAWR